MPYLGDLNGDNFFAIIPDGARIPLYWKHSCRGKTYGQGREWKAAVNGGGKSKRPGESNAVAKLKCTSLQP